MSEWSVRKVYSLNVFVERNFNDRVETVPLMDWQNKQLRAIHGAQSFCKTFDTSEAANKAMMDIKESEPPKRGKWITILEEQFAFRDPSQPEQWHILSTRPCQILQEKE